MRTISLRLDAATDAMLRSLCDRLNSTQTEVVRRALVLLAANEAPTPAAVAAELALVGAFASGDADRAGQHSQRLKQKLASTRAENERSTTTNAVEPRVARRRRDTSR